MKSPQFKKGNVSLFNEKQKPLHQLNQANEQSIIGLYISQFLLTSGFILILLNNLNVVAPGDYFGVYNWVTVTVFSIGLIINFVSIPHLYFSSFMHFRKDNDFWDKETFWILPLFFFGTFFLYGSHISTALILLLISIAVILIIHLRFVWISRKILEKDMGDNILSPRYQYFMTLKYLSVYYIILLGVIVFFDPMQQLFIWIRMNI